MNAIELKKICYPCWEGEHDGCRNHPNDDGSTWVGEGKERRLVLYDRPSYYTNKKEIPRPPCECKVEGHTWGAGTCPTIISAQFTHYRCDKPVKGTLTRHARFGKGEVTIEVCGVHRAAHERKMNNDAKRKEEWDLQRKRDAAQKAASQASEDWATRIAEEFKLPVAALQGTRDGQIRVSMSPEGAYKVLSEIRGLLDDVYGNDHPFALPSEES